MHVGPEMKMNVKVHLVNFLCSQGHVYNDNFGFSMLLGK